MIPLYLRLVFIGLFLAFFWLIVLPWASKKDVALYKNPATKKLTSTPILKNSTDEQLYKIFLAQNRFEATIFTIAFIGGLVVGRFLLI